MRKREKRRKKGRDTIQVHASSGTTSGHTEQAGWATSRARADGATESCHTTRCDLWPTWRHDTDWTRDSPMSHAKCTDATPS
jgi:hypothetical protein